MVEPDDFGLAPLQTLALVTSGERVSGHAGFWKAWGSAVFAEDARLTPRGPGTTDPGDDSASHEIQSVLSVRLGARLVLPEDKHVHLRAALVTTHGYENVPTLGGASRLWQDLANAGVAVLILRVRGYPGSQLDCPGMVRHIAAMEGLRSPEAYRGGGLWITHGLSEAACSGELGSSWALSLAVADVVNACRAMRGWMRARGVSPRVFLHGESFGGGLAVLAASALADREPIDRLVLGVPSMGAWCWRLADERARCRAGTARHVVDLISSRRDLEGPIREMLFLHDAAIHARRVRCPVLCKLALRDEVVPAPAAAAVFNALAGAPGEKWRFLTRYGHFDGGIADVRRHAMFERLIRVFLDPGRDVEEAMAIGLPQVPPASADLLECVE